MNSIKPEDLYPESKYKLTITEAGIAAGKNSTISGNYEFVRDATQTSAVSGAKFVSLIFNINGKEVAISPAYYKISAATKGGSRKNRRHRNSRKRNTRRRK